LRQVKAGALQGAINRRAQARILTKPGISGGVIEAAAGATHEWQWAKAPVERVLTLNMGIYKLKCTMNLLMNLMHYSAVAVALGVEAGRCYRDVRRSARWWQSWAGWASSTTRGGIWSTGRASFPSSG
jgi:hypothetical protein